ncbi:MAG: hypothetical protein LBV41_06680 [Cytophagaceae bacterium]|jgi:hypothetical protein|nr:hypothetical protein [Cytophagaceae bacterium]
MASVQNLKKDINLLASELVMQAYFSRYYLKSINDETLTEIVEEARRFKSSYLGKANHPDGSGNPKLVKAFYKKIKEGLINDFDTLIAKVNVAKK